MRAHFKHESGYLENLDIIMLFSSCITYLSEGIIYGGIFYFDRGKNHLKRKWTTKFKNSVSLLSDKSSTIDAEEKFVTVEMVNPGLKEVTNSIYFSSLNAYEDNTNPPQFCFYFFTAYN